ncbi:MAG TPA: metal ABC transporter ATP-binding protein [Solirubrobacteraceae bacterium]|nr:metal ABC transporter ATP-binding protein [Solirubrobacteraceae bacterium]
MSPPVLSVEDLGVSVAGRSVLREISFRLEAGELTGLIGSNGSGKTTLLRAILGLRGRAWARSGRVLLDGAPLARGSRLIGYVPQRVALDPDLPVRARDLVSLGLDGHRPGFALPSRRRRVRVEEMLDAVGARGFADARVGELSGGEQQRVLLAHALIQHPRLLLLDEPLAGLDLRSVGEAVSLMARVAAEQRVAVLVSAHEINPLLPVMDRIVYLAGGRAVHGTIEQVVRGDVLSGLYGHPVDVLHVHGRVLVVAAVGEDAGASAAPAGVEVLS